MRRRTHAPAGATGRVARQVPGCGQAGRFLVAGYSGTPLAKKLGIRVGSRVRVDGAPPDYLDLLGTLPDDVVISNRLQSDVDLYHLFTTPRRRLIGRLPAAMEMIRRDGMIWVSWPKKASGVASGVVEGDIRAAALPLGLVDVKVCAVDDTWSGLKLVIRRENRSK